jgi:cytochrome P450
MIMKNGSTATVSHRPATAAGSLPILGHAITLMRRPLGFLSSLYGQGDLVEVRIGPKPAYALYHPELAQQVLRDSRTWEKGGSFYDILRTTLGNGLLTAAREPHQRQRRLMQQAFRPDRTPGYATVMLTETEAAIEKWQNGQALDVVATMHRLTTRIAAATLFSTAMDADASAELEWCVPIVQRGMHRRITLPIAPLHRLPTPRNRQYDSSITRLRSVIDRIIAERMGDYSDHGDLLSQLLSARDPEGGESLGSSELHDQVLTLLMAGSETTANALVYSWYLLGKHPEVESRLHAEVDEVLGGRMPTFDDLPRLTYVKQVFTEALRLYPPAWMFTRIATCDTELGSFSLPAGSVVLCSPYILQHDPALFPDPEHFDPDRWSPARVGTVPRGAFVPFGGGTRKCIGDGYAMAEGALILAAIASRWNLRSIPGEEIQPVPTVSLGAEPWLMVPSMRR